jgi:hypothetical protein
MKRKDILNTNKKYNKLIDLLNKGYIIRLYDNHFIIKKENDLLKMISLKDNVNLIEKFLENKNINLTEKEKLEFNNELIEAFLLNKRKQTLIIEPKYSNYYDTFLYFIKDELINLGYYENNLIEFEKYSKISTKTTEYRRLFSKTFCFIRWEYDKFLNSILANAYRFIQLNYPTDHITVLLIKCNLCKNIYDIIEFIDTENPEYGVIDLLDTKKDITNINICTHCYNDLLNKKQLMLRQAVNC